MAAITGKGGTVTYAGGSVATINNWSLDVDNSMHDVTSFTTSLTQWREFIAGLSGWTGSIDGIYDPSSTGQGNLITNLLSPTTAAIVLELDQTQGGKFSGSCLLSAGSFGAPIDGTADLSFSLQGTGAPAFSTST